MEGYPPIRLLEKFQMIKGEVKMFKRLGETWNKAVEWYLTTDFFPYPVPFHKMDEKSLGGEMVSAFNKADIGAK
ncbi:MAG TPA: hypothetical protein VIF12_05185, partial [Micavibrio sp.]